MHEKIEIHSLLFLVFLAERTKNLLTVGLANPGPERVKASPGKIVEDSNPLRWVGSIGLTPSHKYTNIAVDLGAQWIPVGAGRNY